MCLVAEVTETEILDCTTTDVGKLATHWTANAIRSWERPVPRCARS
jgi:hypothetical protein